MGGVSQSLGVTVNLDLDPWRDLSPAKMPLNPGGLSAGITRLGVLPNGTSPRAPASSTSSTARALVLATRRGSL